MLCQKCGKRPANVLVKVNINGQVREEELCSECAAQSQLLNEYQGFSAWESGDLFSHMLDNDFLGEAFFKPGLSPRTERQQVKTCPSCGESFADFRQTGLFGCPSCYETFHDLISGILSQIQGSSQYVASNGDELASLTPADSPVADQQGVSYGTIADYSNSPATVAAAIKAAKEKGHKQDQEDAEEVESPANSELANLQAKLKEAVAQQDFMQAAQLRDEIKELEDQEDGQTEGMDV